jgi:hypothetical protein
MVELSVSSLPLLGLVALVPAVVFAVWLEPVAVLSLVSTLVIVLAIRTMFGSEDIEFLQSRSNGDER